MRRLAIENRKARKPHRQSRRPRLAGSGKNAGNVLAWYRDDAGGKLVSSCPFAGRDQECRENRSEKYPDPGAEQAHLDGVANKKNAAERERKAPDPHDPLRAEPLLQRCWRRRRHGYGWCGRGRLGSFGSGRLFDDDRRRLGGLDRSRGSRLRGWSNAWRTGARRFQRCDTALKSPHAVAGTQSHYKSDDGDDRYRQDQKYQK